MRFSSLEVCRLSVNTWTIENLKCFLHFLLSRTYEIVYTMKLFFHFLLSLVTSKNVLSGNVYGNSTFPRILRDGSKLKSLVLNSDVAYLVQFYSFTCGWVKNFVKFCLKFKTRFKCLNKVIVWNIYPKLNILFEIIIYLTPKRHCHEFAPIFSKFAESIDSWSTSLEVIAIECQGNNHEYCHRVLDFKLKIENNWTWCDT